MSAPIISIPSIGGQITSPLKPLQRITKFAVASRSNALHYELQPLSIRVRIVELGMVETSFVGSVFDFAMDENIADHNQTAEAMSRLFSNLTSYSATPKTTAKVDCNVA
ncbi:hypothetical protein N4R57_15830 [Rhodobacteraceae bacterium D3-12]|nr:hypothetical protein N4R57_15830 [Rhodobacteraceae bacterium D3-12]